MIKMLRFKIALYSVCPTRTLLLVKLSFVSGTKIPQRNSRRLGNESHFESVARAYVQLQCTRRLIKVITNNIYIKV